MDQVKSVVAHAWRFCRALSAIITKVIQTFTTHGNLVDIELIQSINYLAAAFKTFESNKWCIGQQIIYNSVLTQYKSHQEKEQLWQLEQHS